MLSDGGENPFVENESPTDHFEFRVHLLVESGR